MKLGYFMMPLHDPKKDYHQALAEDTDAIILADQLGFEEAWVGEHFTSAAEPITSPLLFMATLIAKTRQIKFGTGVLCLPQYHPAVVAGYAAMFDHLSEGRFIMGIGPGGLPSDFELFGVMDLDRNAMMVESIDMILKILQTEPPYNITNTFWNARVEDWAVDKLGLGRMVKPFQNLILLSLYLHSAPIPAPCDLPGSATGIRYQLTLLERGRSQVIGVSTRKNARRKIESLRIPAGGLLEASSLLIPTKKQKSL